jgi:peptide/nickel transport system substrate-binding protein
VSLRKGVQFHTGREMTSADLVYNLQRPLDPKLQATIPSFTILPGFVPPNTVFEATDKYTFTIKTEQPWPAVFDYFQVLNIMDKETAEGPDSKLKAVGTGPFSFVEWVQGQYLQFAKNKNYWQSGRPYLDGVKVNIKSDAVAMLTELEAGASDIVLAPSWRDFARLKSNPNYQAIKVPVPGTFHQFQPNVTFKPLVNKLVRQALSYALDRQRMIDSIFVGETTPESLPWLPSSPAYEAAKNNHFAFDLDKSKSLLSQAGVSNLALDVVYTAATPEYGQMSEIYQSDLAKTGVTLNLKTLATAQMLDTIQKQTYNGLYTLNDPWASMEPITLFTSSSSAQYRKNNAGYTNDRYTQLVQTVAKEPDAAKRKQQYSVLNDFLLDEAFHMPVTQSPGRILAGASVKGIEFRQMDRFMLNNTWLA